MNTFKILFSLIIFTVFCEQSYSQGTKSDDKKKLQLLKELSESSCKCIDSVSVYNKSKEDVSKDIHRCIDKQTEAYQLGLQIMNINDPNNKVTVDHDKKEINISLNLDKNSDEYKSRYFEMERYLMDNCKALKQKIVTSDKQSLNSMSRNPEAMAQYNKGVETMKKGNFKKAIDYFAKAVKIDPDFAFAWDNLGLCNRKLENYDEALKAYNKSLEIDPKGQMPLQNIAIVYQYKKDYAQAIKAYEKLAEVDNNNPEVYYGIGQIYTDNINNYEAGLKNMCKAYNLYIEQKSPYRTDAEKVIQRIYQEMKKQGKLDKFNEILKANHITTN